MARACKDGTGGPRGRRFQKIARSTPTMRGNRRPYGRTQTGRRQTTEQGTSCHVEIPCGQSRRFGKRQSDVCRSNPPARSIIGKRHSRGNRAGRHGSIASAPKCRAMAREQPTLAKPLGLALMERAGDLGRAGKFHAAEATLNVAEETDSQLRETCVKKRFAWFKNRLDDKDFAGVLRGLDALRIENYPETVSDEAAELYLQLAQAAREKNTAVASRAMDKAFQLQPSLEKTEDNALLWIGVHREPSDEKVRRCKEFLTTFSSSEQCAVARNVLMAVADRWAGEGRPDEAISLAEWLLATHPDAAVKQEIEGKIAAWRAMPKREPRVRPRMAPRRGGNETLEAKLLRRKRTISTSTAVDDAVANKEIWIIEVADSCTADEFDAEQTRLLRNWVKEGGVLWVNSSVLSLLGVQYSSIDYWWGSECSPAGANHPILENVKRVMLDTVRNGAHTLQYRGVIPLLAMKKRWNNSCPAGTAIWSLVPYGKGWISDPKPVDLEKDDGAIFWARFCQFCLHELPWDHSKLPSGSPKAEEATPAEKSFSGTWKSSNGARLSLTDDGTTVTVDLVEGVGVQTFSGKLTRREGKTGLKSLSGKIDAVFNENSHQRFVLDVTAQYDDFDHLKIRIANCPRFSANGRYTGERTPQSNVWTRADGNGARSSRTPDRNSDDPFSPDLPKLSPKPKKRAR